MCHQKLHECIVYSIIPSRCFIQWLIQKLTSATINTQTKLLCFSWGWILSNKILNSLLLCTLLCRHMYVFKIYGFVVNAIDFFFSWNIKYLQARANDFANNPWTFGIFFCFSGWQLLSRMVVSKDYGLWPKKMDDRRSHSIFPCTLHMLCQFRPMIIVAVNYDETLSLLLMFKLLII